MSTSTAKSSTPGKAQGKPEMRQVNILMLHGYTQSGNLFRIKTRAMDKLLTKLLAPSFIRPNLIYPTGPNRLHPSDIPGWQPPPGKVDEEDDDCPPDTWAWFRKDEATGSYRLWDEGMAAIAKAIRETVAASSNSESSTAPPGGHIDGICGFSQGGAVGPLVAAAMEPTREVPAGPAGAWARELREANGGQPLKFAVSYSGFWATDDSLQWCYEPPMATPTLHYRGSLDTVVDEDRTQRLIDKCEDPKVVVHPGGHHVPVAKEWVMPFAAFIKEFASKEVSGLADGSSTGRDVPTRKL